MHVAVPVQVRELAPKTASHAVARARSRHNPTYNSWLQSAHGNQSDIELEWLIREGARGIFVDEARNRRHVTPGRIGASPCTLTRLVAPRHRCLGRCAIRATLLSQVWKLDASLDRVNANLLERLHTLATSDSRIAVVDTVQLWQAGFRDRPYNGIPAEIWDVRYMLVPKALRVRCDDGGCRAPPRHYGRLDGSPCTLDFQTTRCWACNDSRLQRDCSVARPSDPAELMC